MTTPELERLILDRCDGTEWHLSLWYPRATREVMRIPIEIADAEIQRTLFRLIESGRIEVGSVEGADFQPQRFEIPGAGCPDLYVRATCPSLPAV